MRCVGGGREGGDEGSCPPPQLFKMHYEQDRPPAGLRLTDRGNFGIEEKHKESTERCHVPVFNAAEPVLTVSRLTPQEANITGIFFFFFFVPLLHEPVFKKKKKTDRKKCMLTSPHLFDRCNKP